MTKKKKYKFQLKIPSVTENLEIIRDFIQKIAEKAGFDDEIAMQIALAADEACTNVIKHAHRYDARRLIDIQVQYDQEKIQISIADKGKGFDPSQLPKPNLKKALKESKRGGLGIYLIEALMDDVEYDFKPGTQNKVIMTKYLNKKKLPATD